jgi:hypothetical protein
MSNEEMKKAAIPEEQEEALNGADDECSVADIIEGRILMKQQDKVPKEDEKVSKSNDSKDTSMVSEPAFPTSLERAQAGIVAGPGAIAMPGVGVDDGGVANQAPPLAAEQSAFLVQAELVPNSSDVEQVNNHTASDSAVVKAEAMNEREPNDPNFWDLFKLKSVRIALLVLLLVVVALAIGMAFGLRNNGSQATNTTIIVDIVEEYDDDDDTDNNSGPDNSGRDDGLI